MIVSITMSMDINGIRQTFYCRCRGGRCVHHAELQPCHNDPDENAADGLCEECRENSDAIGNSNPARRRRGLPSAWLNG